MNFYNPTHNARLQIRNMEEDMVANMEVDMVADMEEDMVAYMEVGMDPIPG